MKMKYNKYIGITIISITFIVVFIVLAFYTSIVEFEVALSIAAIGLVSPVLVLWVQLDDKKQDDEEHQQIMGKLEKIEKELEKLDQPKNTGVAIADVLASGLKYYAEHMNKPGKEKEND